MTDYREALGFAVGDTVRRNYDGVGEASFRLTRLWGPYWWWRDMMGLTIWPWPVVSLSGYHERDDGWEVGINEVHREPDGRWFTTMGDEVWIMPGPIGPLQRGLFELTERQPEAQPYRLQAGVDYSGCQRVWHCLACGHDFNSPNPVDHVRGHVAVPIHRLVLDPSEQPGWRWAGMGGGREAE